MPVSSMWPIGPLVTSLILKIIFRKGIIYQEAYYGSIIVVWYMSLDLPCALKRCA